MNTRCLRSGFCPASLLFPALTVGLMLAGALNLEAQIFVLSDGYISEYETSGTPINTDFTNLNSIYLLGERDLVEGGGDFFVSSTSYGRVVEVDATTGAIVNNGFVTNSSDIEGLAISGDDLFVGLAGGGVLEYSTSTDQELSSRFISSSGLIDAMTTANGDLFVAKNTGGGMGPITVYSASTGSVVDASLVSGLLGVSGVAVSGNDLYVLMFGNSNSSNGTISEYDATTGAVIKTDLVTGLNYPENGDLTVVGNDLFVSVLTNQSGFGHGYVSEYDATTGAPINTGLITGLTSPGQIIVDEATTPEPSTLALLLSGGVLLAAYSTRRRFFPATLERSAR